MIGTTEDTSRPAGYSSVCHAVVSEVAATIDVPPDEFDRTLNEVVDPDALEKLFAERGGGPDGIRGSVMFEFAGCEVLVQSSGDVTVSLIEQSSASGSGSVGTVADRGA
jgi:hypothetical protein